MEIKKYVFSHFYLIFIFLYVKICPEPWKKNLLVLISGSVLGT